MKLYELTIGEAHRLLKTKEISSVELTQAVLDRIYTMEGKVDAFKFNELLQDLCAKIKNRRAKAQNFTTKQHSKRIEKKILKSTDI